MCLCTLGGGIFPGSDKGVCGFSQTELHFGVGSPYRLPPVPVSVTFLLETLSEINC